MDYIVQGTVEGTWYRVLGTGYWVQVTGLQVSHGAFLNESNLNSFFLCAVVAVLDKPFPSAEDRADYTLLQAIVRHNHIFATRIILVQ